MLNKIFKGRSKTTVDILNVLSGNIVSQSIAFLIVIIVSRILGPESYGIYSLLIVFFSMSIQFADFGISTSYVKYVSRNKEQAKVIFYTVIISKIIIYIVILFFIWLMAEELSRFFFMSYKYVDIIRLCGLAIIFHSMIGVVQCHYQSMQKFQKFTKINIIHNVIKLTSVIIFSIFQSKNNVEVFVFIYAYSVIVLLIIIGYKIQWPKMNFQLFDFKHLREIYKLGFWVFTASLSVMIYTRIDIMMLQKMVGSQAAGIYNVALSLAMLFPLVTTSLTSALLPKLNDYLENNRLKIYVYKILSYAKYLIIILALILIVSPVIIHVFFGKEYLESVSVFQILVIGHIINVIVNPISLVFYYINKAYLSTIINWIQLFLNYSMNIALIPVWGIEGAAVSTVLIYILNGVFVVIYLLNFDYKGNDN